LFIADNIYRTAVSYVAYVSMQLMSIVVYVYLCQTTKMCHVSVDHCTSILMTVFILTCIDWNFKPS